MTQRQPKEGSESGKPSKLPGRHRGDCDFPPEGWGMSECLIATINPPGAIRLGTVGKPLPGVQLTLASDGELLMRGPTVMKGYRNNPAKTAEAIDPGGWLRTGDLATIDSDGYVTITGRKKELIINSAGKNISPANIQSAVLAASPLIAHVVAIGDRRPYITALAVLDPDTTALFAAQHAIPGPAPAVLAAHPAVREAVAAAVGTANGRLSRVEQIKQFAILPVFWEPGGDEITPTMKLKRQAITAKYADTIESLYAAAGQPERIDRPGSAGAGVEGADLTTAEIAGHPQAESSRLLPRSHPPLFTIRR